jgi:SAM-dependent methyltransferase
VLDEVHEGTVEDVLASRAVAGPFDTIVAYDVLEHVVDPAPVVSGLLPLAAPGGRLHVSVPNARHFSLAIDLVLRGTFGYTDWGHRDRTHLRWFTRRDLDALLRRNGWLPRSWSSSAIHRLMELRVPAPERMFPRLGSEFFAYQWFVLSHPGPA